MSKSISGRILQLDGLRGLAVLAILAFHFLNNQYSQVDPGRLNSIEKLLTKATYFGWAGVDLFFVLSGFLIGTILLTNRQSDNFFKAFYLRRFFRIVPIYYLLLIVFLVLKQLPFYSTDIYIFFNDIPLVYYFLFLQNFAMSFYGHFGPEAITPTWSLAVEEQFYLIMPVVVYYFKPSWLKYFIIACLLLAPFSRYLSTNWYMKYTMISSRIDSPIVGFLVALLMQNEQVRKFMKTNIPVIRWSAITLTLISVLIYVFADTGVFNHTLIAVIFGLLLITLILTNSGPVYNLLTLRPLVYIGGISYFVYLFHQLINGLLHLLVLDQKIPKLDSQLSLFMTAAALFITILLAAISGKYLERPLIKFSHHYKY